jgi:hypothetical protein
MKSIWSSIQASTTTVYPRTPPISALPLLLQPLAKVLLIPLLMTMKLTNLGANLMGGYLYESLSQYLKRHLEDVKLASDGLVDDVFLLYYSKEWNRYTVASKYIHHLFRYLNRYLTHFYSTC